MSQSIKYPRTFHFPWSKGCTDDDKMSSSVTSLIGVPIVITEKLDGSNSSLESGGCFARTHSGAPTHPSFDALKAFHATIKYKIPEGIQLFGEYCYARHSIEYDELPNYFMLFNIRDIDEKRILRCGDSMWFGWDEVELWAEKIEVPTVPVLFRGTVKSEKELKGLVESLMIQPSACGGIREGVVTRIACGFADDEFFSSVMKCVRANHVQTSQHWKDQVIIRNKLKIPNTGT